jgi:hypothetical protein
MWQRELAAEHRAIDVHSKCLTPGLEFVLFDEFQGMHGCVVAKEIQTAIRIDCRFNRHASTVWGANVTGYDADPVFSHCQAPLCPGAGIAIAIDCHDAHSLSGKMANNFQSDPRGATGYYRCAFQLSQRDTSSGSLNRNTILCIRICRIYLKAFAPNARRFPYRSVRKLR